MMSDEFAATMTTVVFGLVLAYFAAILLAILIGTAAIFIIGWYITYMLFKWLDSISDAALIEEHSGLLLMISGCFWMVIAWSFVPPHWLFYLQDIWPRASQYPQVVPLLGGLLGLVWGMLVLYKHQDQEEYDLLDEAGMHRLSGQEVMYPDYETEAILSDSLLLGYEDDSWIQY